MESTDLTPQQAEALKAKIGPMLAYLGRLQERLNARQFPPDDKLARDVTAAYNAIHGLNVTVHYISCGKGKDYVVREPPRFDPPAASR